MLKLDGELNMALDRALLAEAEQGRPGLRVYGWSQPWVTLGRFQWASRALAESCPLPWVKRPTGGRGVLHGHDITVGLAIPLELIPERDRTVSRAYFYAVQPIAQAMRECGVEAQIGGDSKTAGGGQDCFSLAGDCDVIDARSGRKLCGCALRLTQRGLLLQASIPNIESPYPSEIVFNGPGPALQPLEMDEDLFTSKLENCFEAQFGTESRRSIGSGLKRHLC